MQDESGKTPPPPFDEVKKEVTDLLEDSKQSATESLHDAKDEVTRKAKEYASEAKEALLEGAEGMQGAVSNRLSAFSGALRAASEHLANSDQRAVSKFVLDAAGGLEKLSGSLKAKSAEEVLNDVRSFGRENSSALLAGSVFAGLALGRLFKADAPTTAPASGQDADGGESHRANTEAGLSDPNDDSVSGRLRS